MAGTKGLPAGPGRRSLPPGKGRGLYLGAASGSGGVAVESPGSTLGDHTLLDDVWGASTRHRDPAEDTPGQRHTQQIERQHLTLRTRIHRLVRQTSCCSKATLMHAIVLGLFVNRYALERVV